MFHVEQSILIFVGLFMSINCQKFNLHLRQKTVNPDGTFSDIYTRVCCKSWDCPHCRPIKGRWLQDQIAHVFADSDLHMLTFTYFQNKPAVEVWKNLGKTWNRLLTYIRKHTINFVYIRIVEPHASGYPHIHVLCNQYLNFSKITKYLTKQGFGWNAHQTAISLESGRNYVAKYLTKQIWTDKAETLRKLSKCRIVSASHGILLTPQSGHIYDCICPKISNDSFPAYVFHSVSEMINTGCFLATIYCEFNYIRINYSCDITPALVPIAQTLRDQLITRVTSDYF
jgi:hypothetical protein